MEKTLTWLYTLLDVMLEGMGFKSNYLQLAVNTTGNLFSSVHPPYGCQEMCDCVIHFFKPHRQLKCNCKC